MFSHTSNAPLDNSGRTLPPVWFSAAPLANGPRVLPDQTKLELIGEWLNHVPPPVVVELADGEGATAATAILGQAIRRFDVVPRELIVALQCAANATSSQMELLREDCCRNMGLGFAPLLVSLNCSLPDGDKTQVLRALELLERWKSSGSIRAVGLCANDSRLVDEVQSQSPLDWVELRGCLTILHHPPEAVALAAKLRQRGIPIVNASVLHSGFLTGGNHLDGRALDPYNDADQRLLTWRKSFAALCHGHGVAPIHAAVQFALRIPGVHAVRLRTSHPDRVREIVAAATTAVPPNFWASMQEDGL